MPRASLSSQPLSKLSSLLGVLTATVASGPERFEGTRRRSGLLLLRETPVRRRRLRKTNSSPPDATLAAGVGVRSGGCSAMSSEAWMVVVAQGVTVIGRR